MIRLGLNNSEKAPLVQSYCADHEIKKVFVLSPARFAYNSDFIDYPDIIMYKTYYRLLQEIDKTSLVVINECLRTQNRYDLTYNCIRNYLNQAGHCIIFQYLPLIDTFDDFMVLLDWDTKSKWRRDSFRPEMLEGLDIKIEDRAPIFKKIFIETGDHTKKAYLAKKRSIIDGLGLKDPHTIPRNLLLLAGKSKIGFIEGDKSYVSRNNRFGNMFSYRDDKSYPPNCTVFEFCHNFIDFIGFLTLSGQKEIDCLVTDLKVDQWYFDRYVQWSERIRDAYAKI
jgi:hypothetical protein